MNRRELLKGCFAIVGAVILAPLIKLGIDKPLNVFYAVEAEPVLKAKILSVGKVFYDSEGKTCITDWIFGEWEKSTRLDCWIGDDSIQIGGWTLDELRQVIAEQA